MPKKIGGFREDNYRWRGGRWLNSKGYVYVLRPDHPNCDSRGYVLKSRLVMEKKIGRLLLPTEIVHHLDHDKQNNHPDNLELFENNVIHLQKEKKRKQEIAVQLLELVTVK